MLAAVMIAVFPTEVNSVMNGSMTFTASVVVIRLRLVLCSLLSILMTLGAASDSVALEHVKARSPRIPQEKDHRQVFF